MKSGRELDALVAEKVMGWKNFGLDNWVRPGSELYNEGPPLYSTHIAAAWAVVEKMREFGKKLVLGNFNTNGAIAMMPSESFHAFFFLKVGQRVVMTPGDSPAHAICLAALKAVGHDVSSASEA